MGKFDRYEQHQQMKKTGSGIHPIWRGIGCVMLILVPLVAYAAANLFSPIAPGLTLMDRPLFPYSNDLYGVFYPFREIGILPQFYNIGFTPIIIIFTIVFTVIGFMIFSLIYAVVYRVTGPPKYGPTDAPPPRRPSKRRRK